MATISLMNTFFGFVLLCLIVDADADLTKAPTLD